MKKNKNKMWLYIAIIAIISFVAVSCDDGNENGNGGTSSTAPAITTASLLSGTVGVPYSQTLAATGTAPITWSVEGTLPVGLTLADATGVISGTPTTAGTANFTVKATNTAGDNTKALSIVITPPVTLIESITVESPAIGFESDRITLVNGGQPNYWVRGTDTARTGDYSLYITNNGTVNAYTITVSSIVHAYVDAQIPADGAFLRFHWRARGETLAGSPNDCLRVYVASTSTTPVAGVGGTNPAPDGLTLLGQCWMGSNTIWGERVYTIPEANRGTTVRIIFTWKNDSNTGSQPPVAIDNIQLIQNITDNTVLTETKLTVGGPAIDFEEGNPLTLVNGLHANYWVRGTATAKDGAYSLYITNDGTANAYTNTVASTVHAYIDAEIPEGGAKLQFNWRAQGEYSMTPYDYMRVYVAPTTTVPIAGTGAGNNVSSSLGPVGSALLGSYYMGGATTWGEPVVTIPAANNGNTVRIIFTWQNDTQNGSQPPAAIDNIKLIAP